MLKSVRMLARDMRERHNSGAPPYVLFIGTGASLAPGTDEISQIIEDILVDYADPYTESTSEEQQIESFFNLLENASSSKRYKILYKFHSVTTPAAGYKHLANLVLNGYFQIIVTSGFDTFLEDALFDAGLWSKDLKILAPQQEKLPRIRIPVSKKDQSIVLIKVHDDPYAPDFWEFWNELNCSSEGDKLLSDAMQQDLVMVGYHPRDSQVNSCWTQGDKELVYVNPENTSFEIPATTRISMEITSSSDNDFGHFDTFFGSLADLLLYRSVNVAVEQSLGDVLEGGSVVGIEISQIGSSTTIRKDSIGGETLDPNNYESGFGFKESDPIEISEMGDSNEEHLKSLRSQMNALEVNLKTLQEKAAMYGTGNAPTYIQRDVESVQLQMTAIEQEIARLSPGED